MEHNDRKEPDIIVPICTVLNWQTKDDISRAAYADIALRGCFGWSENSFAEKMADAILR